MKPLTLFLNPLLALACYMLHFATAHKESKADRIADIDKNFSPHTWPEIVVNHMIFSYSLDDFMIMWNRRVGEYGMTDLVWWTDACTGVDDSPFGWNFKPACIRHDFAYENFRRQGRLSHASRKKIDVHFKEDLYNICDKYSSRKMCRLSAKIYYAGVRMWGKDDKREISNVNAIVSNATSANATTAEDTQADTGGEERNVGKVAGGHWFADWVENLTPHPELLMEMTERELEHVNMKLDAWMEEMDKKQDGQKTG